MLFPGFTNALNSVFAPISIPARAAALAACASQLHVLSSVESKNVSRNFYPPAFLLNSLNLCLFTPGEIFPFLTPLEFN
jgi:hypothetical protein